MNVLDVPEVTLTAPDDGAVVGGSVALSAEASAQAGVERVEFLVDGGVVGTDEQAPYVAEWDTTGVSDDTHTIAARAFDSLGASSDSTERAVTVDNTAPASPTVDLEATSDTGSSDTDDLTNDATPTLVGDAEAGTTVEVFDGADPIGTTTAGSSGRWSFTATEPLSDGAHELTVVATDAAGNASPASSKLTVTVDTASPTVSNVQPTSGNNTVAAASNVEATFSEGMNTSTLSGTTFTLLRKGTTTPVAATVNYDSATKKAILNPSVNLAAGTTYTATVKGGMGGAKDPAGNPLVTDKVWIFSINGAPTITNLAPAPGATVTNRTPTIGATVRDGQTNLTKNRIAFYLDGKQMSTFAYDASTDRLSFTPSSRLALGWHTVRVVATDPQGLQTTASWRFNVG